MYCTNCGHHSTKGDKYCANCGAMLRFAATAAIMNGQNDQRTQSTIGLETHERASQTKRFLNHILDIFGYLAACFLGGIFIGIIFVASGNQDNIDTAFDGINGYLFGLAVLIVYYWGLESATGRTLGKLVTGTKVVDQNGEKPTSNAVVKRTLARFIPFEAFSLFGSTHPIAWHDSLSKTQVVQLKKAN